MADEAEKSQTVERSDAVPGVSEEALRKVQRAVRAMKEIHHAFARAADEAQFLSEVCRIMVEIVGYRLAEESLDHYREGQPGCPVTDVRMLGMDGLELQDTLRERDILLLVIVITAYARTPLTVRAIKAGAVTVLEKPYVQDELWNAIRKALAEDATKRVEHERRQELRNRIAQLTPSEREVMDMIVDGAPNKTIARRLALSLRTVENRRRAVFEKTQADSVAELVRMVIDANLDG